MISVMRILTIITCGALLLLQTGGLLCFYQIKIKVLEISQQKLLNQQKKSETQTFALNDFNSKCINKHELVLDGKMYDFSIITQTKNQITVRLISDKREDDIVYTIGQFFGKDQSGKSSKEFPKQLIKWLQTPYIGSIPWHWQGFTLVEISYSIDTIDFYPTILKEIIPNPPRA